MKVYLAGEREAATDASGQESGWFRHARRRLFSYYYHGFKNHNMPSRDVEYTAQCGKDLFLDSGAFTAFSQGAEISIDDYAEYIHKTFSMWSVCACLDSIGDAKGSYENLKALESNGCHVAPVFHCREDTSWLQRYLDEGYEYILLGGMVPESTKYLRAWLDDLWGRYLTHEDGTPRVQVHGFGLTDQTLMFRYPWYSVDSSSWLMTGIFGACVFTTPSGLRKVVFSEDSPEAKRVDGWHYSTMPEVLRQEVDKWLEEFEVTPEQLASNYRYRDAINAATFQRMESMAATKFTNQQQVLFDA